jgi:cell division protein FtsQ
MTVVESAQRFGATQRTHHWRRWLALVVVAVLVSLAVWVVWFSALLSVREVRVVGAVNVSADEVRQAAAVPMGVPLVRADVDGVTARVGAIPRVGAVEVRRGYPDVLVVVVTERTPVAVTRDGAGLVYVDATGMRFGSMAVAPRGMPVVTASTEPALRSAVEVVAALPATLRSTVTAVTAHSRDDVVLRLPDGATVQWGSAEQSDRKAAVLAALLHVHAAIYDVSAPDLPTSRGALRP